MLRIDHCSIFVIMFSISSLYGFVSSCVSSILSNYLSCSSSCCIVSMLIISPDSVFLYMYLVCSLVRNCPMLGQLLFTYPPILELRGKNAVGPFLPFISVKDLLLDFLLDYSVHLSIERFDFLPDWAFAGVVLFLFLLWK